MRIAIDGFSAAGKSTVSRAIAQRLNILYLDTGAMYRAVALKALNTACKINDEDAIKRLIETTDLAIKYANGEQKIYLDGVDVGQEIRRHDISKLASYISAIPAIRLFLVDIQRKIALASDCVLDGRDIGTFVLPDAEHKFYLTATIEERAQRRYKELLARGQSHTLEEIKEDIKKRDYNDMNREFAPLKKAADAMEIDSTHLSADEVADIIIKVIGK